MCSLRFSNKQTLFPMQHSAVGLPNGRTHLRVRCELYLRVKGFKIMALLQVFRCLPVSIIPSVLRSLLHLNNTYQKDKRAKPGNHQRKQCCFEFHRKMERKDLSCERRSVYYCFIS
jgi:hypothetical protein